MNGFTLQLIHLSRELARRHDVCVVAPGTDADRRQAPKGVELVTVMPPSESRASRALVTARGILRRWPRRALILTPAMSAAVRHLLAERTFDVAQVAGPPLARLAREFSGLPAVLSTLDAWHLNAAASANMAPAIQRPFYRLEERTVRRFGASSYAAFQRVVVVSEADAEALRELDPTLPLDVIPNGVDSDHLAPNPSVERERDLVVFTGAMQWPPNAEAAVFMVREVLPRLRSHLPDVRLAIVGRNPGPAVRALASIDGVEVTGEVPDVRPWLWRAGAFACPMVSGTGIKNKLLEALACEAPSVATPLSCQGLEVVPGRDLKVARPGAEFATAIAEVLSDRELGRRLGSAGRRAVIESHSWDSVARSYERIYDELVRARTGSSTLQPPAEQGQSSQLGEGVEQA